MKSVTFDEKLYKIVPRRPTVEMIVMGAEWSNEPGLCYQAALSEVSDDLPGVVTHTGEPAGYMVQYSCAAQDGSMIDGPFAFVDESDASEYERRIGIPMFTHPAPDAIAIVKAALEAAARYIEKQVIEYDRDNGKTDPDTGTREYPGDGIEWVGDREELIYEIRAIDPQSILDGLNK